VEDEFYMKKYSPLIALTLLAGCLALSPLRANAQDEKQNAQDAFEREWYDTCYQKKPIDAEKCYQQSKELLEKFPTSKYAPNATRNVKGHEKNKVMEKFQAAFTAYSNAPDAAKLDQLFAASDECLKGDKIEPALQQFVLGRTALAGASGAMAEFYKNLDKVKGYAENALKAFEAAAPPEGWKKEEWDPLREILLPQMNQYLGWHFIMGTKSDKNQGLNYLTKAIQVKCKDCAGWKDPNNYYLRSTVYYDEYVELRKPYDAMTNEQKTGPEGKEALKKIRELLDTKLIPEYARILATATRPEVKGIHDYAKSEFDSLWEFRTGAKDKAPDYIKYYVADPTIASVPVPAKPDDAADLNAPAAPTPGAPNVKLQATKPGGATGAKAPANSNGSKSAPTKGKTKPKSRKRG
jgi:hypothetical protein